MTRRDQLIHGMAVSIVENGAIITPVAIAEECDALGLTVQGQLTTETELAIEALGVALPPSLPESDNKPFFTMPETPIGPDAFSNKFAPFAMESVFRALAKLRNAQ